MRARSLGAAILLVALAAGCQSADDDVEPAIVPKPVAFEGNVDAKYAGDWIAAPSASRLNLEPDGAALIESTTNSQAGKSVASYKGRWLTQDGRLLVQYADSSGTTTLKYDATLKGDKLILQQPGGRLKTTYTLKSPQTSSPPSASRKP